MLKLNDDKTETLLISSNNSLNGLSLVSVKVVSALVNSRKLVTTLSCIFESLLQMYDFIVRKCHGLNNPLYGVP